MVKIVLGLSFNSSCIGQYEALPLTRSGSGLVVIGFSAGLPVLLIIFSHFW